MSAWLFAQKPEPAGRPDLCLCRLQRRPPRALAWKQADADLAVEEFDISLTMLYVQMAYGYWRQYGELYP